MVVVHGLLGIALGRRTGAAAAVEARHNGAARRAMETALISTCSSCCTVRGGLDVGRILSFKPPAGAQRVAV